MHRLIISPLDNMKRASCRDPTIKTTKSSAYLINFNLRKLGSDLLTFRISAKIPAFSFPSEPVIYGILSSFRSFIESKLLFSHEFTHR
uniref:Alpha-beta-hydrolase n=1 Tax=Ophiocordycipitaceae sp. TaxID=1907519 RepID=A0A7S8CTU7_9HYPO|nr:alpha-beta-hydrolase [Ophiocordycipitaceae sp.]QUT09502.1 alpha-beta-hydrolase [Ophiocordycipitaceae sp.]QUT09530.1 alpha-beta-hydrolase [Ophiocordycipitaceae sp.]QUT13260.1 alpha-beta-hydrolase [Ophiocordycipitaceae sp.]DAJ12181.1 TPA_asm: alpha-beta-hydrolase [Ophiocordycipitaceae sp.]